LVDSYSDSFHHIISPGAFHPPTCSARVHDQVPQLFGHEIVAILCGVVWGLWVGFAIVAAGTFLGELGNF
jgi:uncharacterized membrane protein YdjX (TVP38/TMEM64 family)